VKNLRRFTSAWTLFSAVIVLGACFSILSIRAEAQIGKNAVYNSSSTCSPCTPSTAFIDASVFANSPPPLNRNFCGVLNFILSSTTYPLGGAVIDARGLNSGNTSMTCTSSPWGSGSGYLNEPSTILLPATGGASPTPIIIPSTWVLPSSTRLIGEGSNATGGTTIQALANNFATNTPMIQFGLSSTACSSVCTAISVEDLTLDGQGQFINGIQNANSGQLSYVNNVNLYQIRDTGLQVSGNAQDSGPYSNITFDVGSYSGLASTVCANVNGLSGTRGIHGLSCISDTSDSSVAVYLDSSNTTIEDVTIAGFYNGILVGSVAAAQSDILLNISGNTHYGANLVPINVVVISSAVTGTSANVSDVSLVGINNAGPSGTNSISDQLTSTTLSDTYVAMYALGKPKNGGYSRFTTSPNAATWAAGTSAPSTTVSCNAATAGSLYSNTSPSASPALYLCPVGGGTWVSVK
jgi:hypothetical protein